MGGQYKNCNEDITVGSQERLGGWTPRNSHPVVGNCCHVMLTER